MTRVYACILLGVVVTACDITAERADWDPGRFDSEHAGATTVPHVYTTTFQAGEAVWPTPMQNPYAESVDEGRRFYIAFNCAGCHGTLGGGGIGPPFATADFIYGNEPAQIFQSMAQGRPNGMPAYGGKAPDEVLWKIAAYVRHLSAPGRPHSDRTDAEQAPGGVN